MDCKAPLIQAKLKKQDIYKIPLQQEAPQLKTKHLGGHGDLKILTNSSVPVRGWWKERSGDRMRGGEADSKAKGQKHMVRTCLYCNGKKYGDPVNSWRKLVRCCLVALNRNMDRSRSTKPKRVKQNCHEKVRKTTLPRGAMATEVNNMSNTSKEIYLFLDRNTLQF